MRLSPLLLILACRPDDVNGDPTEDGGSTDGGGEAGDGGGGGDGGGDGGAASGDCEGSGLLGDWRSEGEDISALFQLSTFDYARVDASFGADCLYRVDVLTNGGDEYVIMGSWEAQEGSPGSITQWQDYPYAARAEGIWQVAGEALSFEVVQVDPDYGFTAPTPSTGFGSTAGQGLAAGDNVQTYRRL